VPEDVTICIPTYNQAAYLPLSIDSALAQTASATRVVVRDDASTDATPEVLGQYADRRTPPKISVIRGAANVGMAENHSLVMAGLDTEFIVRFDSDDLLEPDFVATLLPLMRAHPRAGYAHAAVLQIDAAGRPIRPALLRRPPGFQDADRALTEAVRGFPMAANIICYRRTAVEELNFFHGRPDFTQDYDLAARMAAAGWGNVYSDRVLARYRVWTDPGGARLRRKRQELSGYVRLFDEVLAPAYQQRGWPTNTLRRRRQQLALDHAPVCFLPPNDAETIRVLVDLLRTLGTSRRLEIKLALCSAGAAPLLESVLHARGRLKNLAKRMLVVVRGLRNGRRARP
jgi:GT2 family glycosyltransferase